MVTCQRELAPYLIGEMRPLIERHYEEIARYQDIPLDPDYAAYCAAEESGRLRCYTLRRDSNLIGYAIFVVQRNLHYRGSLQAIQDILFVVPEHRGAHSGLKLIRFCDAQLRNEGVQVVYQHVKAAHNFGPVLEREGYELLDLVFGKRLDVAINRLRRVG